MCECVVECAQVTRSECRRWLSLALLLRCASPRARTVGAAACREELFRQYTADLERAEEALRERAAQRREAERRLEAEQRAAGQRQRAAARSDALAHYGALLQELHLVAGARWRDHAERIRRDAQASAVGLWLGLHTFDAVFS